MDYSFKLSIFFLITFGFSHCSSATARIASMSDEELIQELTSRSYRYYRQNIGHKTQELVPALEMTGKGNYLPGDLVKVCSIKKLKFLDISWGKLPEFSEEEVSVCRNSNINTLFLKGIELKNSQICEIAKGLKAPKVRIDYDNIELLDTDIECFSQVSNLDTFIVGSGAKITDEGMCKFTANAKNLTFLRMDDIEYLTKKSTDCMLNLPSLKEVMLLRWKKVPENQMEKFVSAYEAKYKRKLDADIYDPTSYEKP
ncbi:hypothetical protein [Leptospira vanthielii]|uniref:Leucine-rich repeat domain-containing protein n=1 Tax=Leptospira vanthielii TaxID=293085 RepID=A0ABY2NPK4_9LEPT|nr:hypothetical protein [Leptospira vanthielii]TGM58041.1 hypothetical protein EHQ95_07115 [Leptospira vanthielii]